MTTSAAQHRAAWELYLPSLEALMPGLGEQERRDRAGLMLIRDFASARRAGASWEAGQALYAIEAVARLHALGPLRGEQLTATRLALVRIFTGHRELERVFGHGHG
jgi:hypothetical protein